MLLFQILHHLCMILFQGLNVFQLLIQFWLLLRYGLLILFELDTGALDLKFRPSQVTSYRLTLLVQFDILPLQSVKLLLELVHLFIKLFVVGF